VRVGRRKLTGRARCFMPPSKKNSDPAGAAPDNFFSSLPFPSHTCLSPYDSALHIFRHSSPRFLDPSHLLLVLHTLSYQRLVVLFNCCTLHRQNPIITPKRSGASCVSLLLERGCYRGNSVLQAGLDLTLSIQIQVIHHKEVHHYVHYYCPEAPNSHCFILPKTTRNQSHRLFFATSQRADPLLPQSTAACLSKCRSHWHASHQAESPRIQFANCNSCRFKARSAHASLSSSSDVLLQTNTLF
jgi:hypothetical protein